MRFASRTEASRAVVTLDQWLFHGRPCRVAAAQMYFRQPNWSAMFEGGRDDDMDDGGGGAGAMPMSFASRGSKLDEASSRVINYKWRALFCKLCGLRGADLVALSLCSLLLLLLLVVVVVVGGGGWRSCEQN